MSSKECKAQSTIAAEHDVHQKTVKVQTPSAGMQRRLEQSWCTLP